MKKVSIPLYLASRALRRGNKGTLILTILVLAMSFVLMVFFPSLMGGLVGAYNQQVIDFQYGDLVVEPNDDKQYITSTHDIVKKIKRIPGVIAVSAHTPVSTTLTSDKKTLYWRSTAIVPSDDRDVIDLPGKMIEGRYLSDGDLDTILIGTTLAGHDDESKDSMESLGGVHTGDVLLVTFQNGVQKKMQVCGIFETKYMSADSNAFITQRAMDQILGEKDISSSILIKGVPGNDAGVLKNRLYEYGIQEKVKTWQEKGEGVIGTAVGSFSVLTLVMGVFSLVIASIVIFIIVYINTINQRRQIGILKAIGIPERDIIRDYLIQVGFIFCIGTSTGVLIFAAIREYLRNFPMEFPVGFVYPVFDISVLLPSCIALGVVSLIAGFLPAHLTVQREILDLVNG